ncbi:MAG: glycosyltransferase [Thermoanaerobaculia bacterium]
MKPEETAAPRISLIIPAFNEEELLPRLLDSVDAARAAFDGKVEVIVADNLSTDATAELARRRGCRVVVVEPRSIACVRNGGAAAAQGEILAFTDADGRIHRRTFEVIDAAIASGRIVAGATGGRFERWSLGLAVTFAAFAPIAVATGFDTGVVFCQRADFAAVGGYDESRLFAEDVAFLLALRRHGKTTGRRLSRPRGARTVISTRKFDRWGDWHFFTRMPAVGWRLLKDPKAATDFARQYWYRPER